MSKTQILPAGRDDVEGILSIQEECGLSRWSRSEYLGELRRQGSILLIAKVEEESGVRGFILGRIVSGEATEVSSEAEIYNIGVTEDHRRQGTGGILLDSFLEQCHQQNVAKVWLEVRASNAAAKTFYSNRGFVVTGRRPGFYSNPIEDADLMCLTLSRSRARQTNRLA